MVDPPDNLKEPKAVAEGRALLDSFYGFDNPEPGERYLRATPFRENAIRLVIIETHLAIEDLLKWFLYQRLSGTRTLKAGDNVRYVQRMNGGEAIDLSARLGIIDKRLHRQLSELNALRNRAGHVWSLDQFKMVRAPGTSKRRRRYTLHWKGARLTANVMQDEFMPLYGKVYIDLFLAYLDARYPDD